jgi:quercetin dioxygenase-like cupin family protein
MQDLMIVLAPESLEFQEAWIDELADARWRSASGHGAAASGSSVIEVQAGRRLPRHTDSAEEAIVVLAGAAAVTVGDEEAAVPAGGVAVIPKDVPHEVRNAGDETLRFVAVYAEPEVVTTYEHAVQPDGSRERQTVE